MKNAVFWDVTPCSSLKTDVSEAISSSETSVLTRATRHNISEDGILYRDFLLEIDPAELLQDVHVAVSLWFLARRRPKRCEENVGQWLSETRSGKVN
jgi:hypothetical protein